MKCAREDCERHLGLVSYEGYCSKKCQHEDSLPARFREAVQLELFPDYQEQKERRVLRRVARLLFWG